MIIYAHGQRNQYDSTPIRTVLCAITFANITIFFFLSFMNICFDTIVSHPPPLLLLVLFIIMGLDIGAGFYLLRTVRVELIINSIIMIFLILSWTIDNQYTLFLSGLVLLRFPEIVKFNEIIQDKLRSRKYLFKIYVLIKIIYLFMVVGHVLGCIFYSIDHTMIKLQYYGSIEENPQNYYQGKLLCYSPIYSLSQINRYLYCMYYIFSLMATVAYGDIIPKNAHENAYVCFLLVFATVSAGFIIEQMLIVFNDYWFVTVFQLRKVRYFNAVLKQSSSISESNRFKLANFLIYLLIYEASKPQIKRLSNFLRIMIMYETVQQKKDSSQINVQPVSNVSLKSCQMEGLPIFLLQFLLIHLQFKLYPDNYILIDNCNVEESSTLFITLRGKIRLGYGSRFFMAKQISSPRKLICWRQFLFNNKPINPYFKVQILSLCEVLAIKSSKLHQILSRQRQQSRNNQFYSQMLQSYYMAMESELLKIHSETKSYSYIDQSIQERNQKNEDESKPSHQISCWSCGNPNHLPDSCPVLHYKVSPITALNKRRVQQQRGDYKRKTVESRKMISDKRVKKGEEMVRYVNRKKEEIQYLKRLVLVSQQRVIEKCEKYSYFHVEYNMG